MRGPRPNRLLARQPPLQRDQSAHHPSRPRPTVHPGSAILWDYRIYHTGLANHGTTPRPVIFSALSRDWWVEIDPREAKNYRKL